MKTNKFIKFMGGMFIPYLALAAAVITLIITISVTNQAEVPADPIAPEVVVEYVEKEIDSVVPEFVDTEVREELIALILECDDREVGLYQMKDGADTSGFDVGHAVADYLEKEIIKNDALRAQYWERYIELGYLAWDKRAAEYPEATYIWQHLKSYGYSDVVCAAIMGNIMIEVGGRTLELKPLAYNKTNSHYGICQWSRKYYPQVDSAPLEIQCEFLTSTLANELNQFGSLYNATFTHDVFVNMTDVKAATLAFAMVYERCGTGSYATRQVCALAAYEYFVD